ncbi:MAG: DinB family protein, partial [Hyphomicrobiales bacterium]|nr:DinB family protein [Hyphomicrobiales bacterium]
MQHRYSRPALYNSWANRRLYDAAASLGDADYRADRGAFFKSMHGTLNHLLVGDRLWMRRLTGEGDAPTRLDAILFEDFGELRRAREIEDRRIEAFVDGLDEKALDASFSYSTLTNPA